MYIFLKMLITLETIPEEMITTSYSSLLLRFHFLKSFRDICLLIRVHHDVVGILVTSDQYAEYNSESFYI